MAECDPRIEKEVLELLEEALGQPNATRYEWLERKLEERQMIGQRVEDLLAFAKWMEF